MNAWLTRGSTRVHGALMGGAIKASEGWLMGGAIKASESRGVVASGVMLELAQPRERCWHLQSDKDSKDQWTSTRLLIRRVRMNRLTRRVGVGHQSGTLEEHRILAEHRLTHSLQRSESLA